MSASYIILIFLIITGVLGVITFFLWHKKHLNIAGIFGASTISALLFTLAVHVVCLLLLPLWGLIVLALPSMCFLTWWILGGFNYKFFIFCALNIIIIPIVYYGLCPAV